MSNHPKPMLNNSTHFAISEMMWFKNVRGGSMSLNYTEPSLYTATSLQWKQGVQGAYALVRGGSSTSNLIEPT